MSQGVRRARTVAAWVLLVGSVIGWPVAALWLARDEPQFVLGLSFLAIIIESASLLTSSQVAEDVNDGQSEGD
jgi:hypothetical protein